MQTLNEVKKCGFNSPDEFFKAYAEMKSDVNNSISEMKEIIELLEKHKKEIQITMHYLDIYRDNKETYDYYKNKTMYPERYFRNHESEILLFTEAKQELLKRGNEIPNAAKLKNNLDECEEKIAQARERIASLSTDFKEYDVIKHNLDVIYERNSDERDNAKKITDNNIEI